MKVAVTYADGKVGQHFGSTEYFKIYTVDGDKVSEGEVVSTAGASHHALVDFLLKQGVDTVICGGIGAPMVTKLSAKGIKVYPGVEVDLDRAVTDLLTDNLVVNQDRVHSGCKHNHSH